MTSAYSNLSGAGLAGNNLTIEPIEKLIFAGLQQKLMETFEVRTGWLTSTDKMQVLQRMFGSTAQGTTDIAIQYPYGFLTFTGLNETTDRINSHAIGFYGPTVVVLDDGKRGYRAKMVPVEFAIKFTYITNSYNDILKIAPLLMISRRFGWLKFNVAYGRATFGISVMPDGQVSVPQQENDLGSAKEYELEIPISMYGFVSLPTLIEQQIVKGLQVTASVDPATTQPNSGSSTAFWSFDSTAPSTPTSNTVQQVTTRVT